MLVAELAVRIVRGALVVGAQHVLHVFDGDLAIRLASPWNVVRSRLVVGVLTVPLLVVRVEETLHVPGARGVVNMVGIRVGAERVARVERGDVLHGQVQMVAFDEFAEVRGAHVLLLVAERVVEVEFVDAELVRHGHVCFVRHTLGDPVVASDGFKPPDLVHIGEGDTVHLVRAVLFEQRAETGYTFAGGLDVRQYEGEEVLFANAAGHFRLVAVLAFLALGRSELHERVGTEHALVGGEGFGGAHGHIRLIDAGFAPNAFLQIRVRHGRVLQRLARQVDFHVGQHALVVARLLVRLDDDEALRAEFAVRAVLIAGDDGRSVIACVLADQNRGACHICTFLSIVCLRLVYLRLFLAFPKNTCDLPACFPAYRHALPVRKIAPWSAIVPHVRSARSISLSQKPWLRPFSGAVVPHTCR